MKKYLLPTLLTFSSPAFADHPTIALGNEASGPIVTIASSYLPMQSWSVGFRTEVIENDHFSDGQLISFADSGLEDVHSVDKLITHSLSLAYGISDDLTLSVRLPYIERHNISAGEIEDSEAEAHHHGDSQGFGDLLLLGNYRMLSMGSASAGFVFGVKLPTGKTDDKDDHGERFETEFQPGTGSWDFLIGASASHQLGRVGYHANVLYDKTNEGAQSTEIGDALTYNLAVTYQLTDPNHHHTSAPHTDFKWDAVIEVNGETRRRNEIRNVSDDNSGGTAVFVSPGLRLTAGNLSGFVSVGLPVIENQFGKQTDINTRIMAGLSVAY